ncbi:uncharacterized protein [Linepithema humile]|uniref:uncharacterized protein n=1 Tax=Linepithema humile TaxID=83485 RepID=UPI00351ECAB2
MKQIFEIEESAMVQEDIARSWYRKSHNHYKPSEQITRDYKKPFDKSAKFGKSSKSQGSGSQVKRILTWINNEPLTLINRRQADFIESTRSFVGQIKNRKTSRFYQDVRGKKNIKDEFDASDALRDSELDKEILFWWQCLQDLSNFRQKLKTRIPEVLFLDIEDEFSRLDKECIAVLPEETIFMIFKKYRICPNKEFLVPLMDTLQLRKEGNIHYRELLNILNWKRNLPVLPKTKQASLASSDYTTTYSDSIGNVQMIDNAKVRAAGLPSKKSDFLTTILHADICSTNKKNQDD